MKKFKKKPFLIGLACVLGLAVTVLIANNVQGAYTTSKTIQVLSQSSKANVSANMHDINPVVYKTVLIIDGEENPLPCTFESNEEAMGNVKKRNPEFLRLAEQKWGLHELNNSNWKEYQKKLIPYTAGLLPDDLGGSKYYMQYQEVSNFFGIYQDEEMNRESLNYVAYANTMLNTKIMWRVSLAPLIHNMPFTNPLVWKYGKP